MKILNLYAGIGGNRALWGDDHDITAVENMPEIADIYRKLWPTDTVVEADAHQYLLDHYKEFDFIWSSPPCPTHSRLNTALNPQGYVRYPEMGLYQEIIFLKHFCSVPWVVENVVPYYKLLVTPTRELARHLFWTNFHLSKYFDDSKITIIKDGIGAMQKYYGIDLAGIDTKNKRKMLRNCVIPKLGLHVFNCKDNLKQEALFHDTPNLLTTTKEKAL
jgi:DNA (cytosine-5)-methyltransferase 1